VAIYYKDGQPFRQDEDHDFDGVADARFEGGKPATLPARTPIPGAPFEKLDCGSFDRFWRTR
jgi:hypothetical protein